MTQFVSTEHANQAAKDAFGRYRSDEERINEIENKIKNGEVVSPEDVLWVCGVATLGIWAQKSSWYDH